MGASFDESTGNAEIWCDVCGEPLTHSDKYGMHCDNECERNDDIKGYKITKGLIKSLEDIFNNEEEK